MIALPSDKQARWRDVALWVMAEAQERSVNVSEAIRTLREAQRLRDPAQNQLFSSNLDLFLASALFDNGQRLEAIQVCKEAIARFTDLEGRVSPLATSMVSRLGLYLCEENLLDQAHCWVIFIVFSGFYAHFGDRFAFFDHNHFHLVALI